MDSGPFKKNREESKTFVGWKVFNQLLCVTIPPCVGWVPHTSHDQKSVVILRRDLEVNSEKGYITSATNSIMFVDHC